MNKWITIINIVSYRASCSENYRQLQLLRGVRAVEETDEEKSERAMTRSETKVSQQAVKISKLPQLQLVLPYMNSWTFLGDTNVIRCGTDQEEWRLWSRRRRRPTWPAPGSSSPSWPAAAGSPGTPSRCPPGQWTPVHQQLSTFDILYDPDQHQVRAAPLVQEWRSHGGGGQGPAGEGQQQLDAVQAHQGQAAVHW